MNKVVLINYANDKYRKTQKLNTWTGKHLAGFKNVIEYGPNDIDKEFYNKNKKIFDIQRGNGLWLWKPYIIYKTLKELQNGDVVFYCDSGACFFRSVKPILKILEKQNIWVSTTPFIERQFTKKLTFKLMECDNESYKNSNQIQGGFIAIKKSDDSMNFIKEWLDYCCNIEIISPEDNKEQEEVGFYAHREDQSVLSLLIKKYHLKVYSDPTQYGRLPEKYFREGCIMNYYLKEDYPICIILHRTANADFKNIFKQWLCAILPRRIGLKFIDTHDNKKGLKDGKK